MAYNNCIIMTSLADYGRVGSNENIIILQIIKVIICIFRNIYGKMWRFDRVVGLATTLLSSSVEDLNLHNT